MGLRVTNYVAKAEDIYRQIEDNRTSRQAEAWPDAYVQELLGRAQLALALHKAGASEVTTHARPEHWKV
jgi:hypothetical protein